ncbi:hypothetical protein D3C87_2139750 [compost metagenome]
MPDQLNPPSESIQISQRHAWLYFFANGRSDAIECRAYPQAALVFQEPLAHSFHRNLFAPINKVF